MEPLKAAEGREVKKYVESDRFDRVRRALLYHNPFLADISISEANTLTCSVERWQMVRLGLNVVSCSN